MQTNLLEGVPYYTFNDVKVWECQEFVRRFVNDYRLPINVLTTASVFFYELDLYEDAYKSRTYWNKALDIIRCEYHNNPNVFLDEYYKIRDTIITTVEKTDEYKAYCNSEEVLAYYKKRNYPACQYNMIFNQECAGNGKAYWSFDMKNANFQVMHNNGVIAEKTYRDFLAQYASGGMLEYLTDSKYTRQVIFGKLNPSRTTKYEKAVMLDIYTQCVMPVMGYTEQTKPAVFNADEFIIEAGTDEQLNQITDNICKLFPTYSIRVEEFSVTGTSYGIVNGKTGEISKIGEIYHKSSETPGQYNCCHNAYRKIVHKLMAGKEVDEMDKIFMYDKCIARFDNDFGLIPFSK